MRQSLHWTRVSNKLYWRHEYSSYQLHIEQKCQDFLKKYPLQIITKEIRVFSLNFK